ncbi:acyltransferase [Rhodopirellula sallentina]|uniref:Hexapeptide repeat-containing transferase n=1 Tax=Rhodopirellula sallentina SM41 TaxID=1263870 RepID=M5U346_9BACT|nr:acyltransferase [Rhodopirellula sallentina]EMI52271.1 hexapeptide repeat-containing transferase [Rhodopirellula sallentina SM41]
MRLLDSLLFRSKHLLGMTPMGRPDVVPPNRARRWIRSQDGCTIESDLRIQGHPESLERISVGKQCGIDKGCIFWIAADEDANPLLELGDRTYVGPYCFLGAYLPLTIGENTIIGSHSYLITANHQSARGTPVRDQGYDAAPIQIGRDVWIGCHTVILPGVTIGDHAVIGAGAVVNKDVPEGEKWAGVPAKKIGERV